MFSGHTGYIAKQSKKHPKYLLEMTRAPAILLTVLFFLAAPHCFAQTRIAISYPDTEQKEQVVNISYYINDSEAADKFLVSLVVTDPQGNRLNASSLSGDVGTNVSGGGLKHIAWDAGADSILLDEAIDIRIVVEALGPTRQEILALEEARIEQENADRLAEENLVSKDLGPIVLNPQTKTKTYTRTGLVFQSLLFPGWGLSRLEKKPHWIKGLAAYGCVAGSIVYNRKAVDTYNQIDNYDDYESKDALYQEAMQQDNISEILAYSAVGIWVADFVWTLLGTRDVSGVNVITQMDPYSQTPMIGLTYSF